MKQRDYNRGETSVQSVILIPVVFVLYFLSAHVAAIFHVSQVAQLAAEQGAQVAATAGTFSDNVVPALNRMESVVHDLGSSFAVSPTIRETTKFVESTVTLRVPRIVPFLPTTVTRTSHASWERFMKEQER